MRTPSRSWTAPFACVALLAACDCAEDPAPREAPGTESTAAETQSVPPAPEGSPSGPPEPVELTTSDGVRLHGTLRRGGDPSAPAVVLVHKLSADRGEVGPVVEALSEPPGMTTLAIDLRGHGESTSGPDDTTLSWGEFETSDWEAAANDVRAAVGYLAAHDDLDPAGIGVVGSSIGSSAAIVAAAEDERVDAVVAISPGRAYRGVDAITPVDRFGERVALLAVASEGELPAAEAAQNISRIADRGTLQLYPGEVHGVAIAEAHPEMLERIRRFLARELGD